MARMIKCPRCQSSIDVTSVTGGATVRCGDCGAMVRVPTGSTGVRPAVSTPVAQAAPPARSGGRSTALFKKMAGTRAPGGTRPPSRASVDAEERGGRAPMRRSGSMSPAALSGIVIGVAVVLILGCVFLYNSKQTKIVATAEAKRMRNEQIKRDNEKKLEEFRKQAAADEAADKAAEKAEKAGKKPALQKDASGAYKIPTTFEPGATSQVKGGASIKADPSLMKDFEGLVTGGRIGDVVADPGKWFPVMVVAFLSDNETVARGAFQALQDLCKAKNITTDSGKSPVRIEFFNSAQWRGGEYSMWSDWWEKPQNKLAVGVKDAKLEEEIRTKGGSGDASKANWDKLMQDLRAGGAFDQADRPEGKAFEQVKSMGPAAYPHLIKFIDNEDIVLAKAAVKVLNALTNRDGQAPTEATKASVKTEWETWAAKQGK
jgi:hypothetical protein